MKNEEKLEYDNSYDELDSNFKKSNPLLSIEIEETKSSIENCEPTSLYHQYIMKKRISPIESLKILTPSLMYQDVESSPVPLETIFSCTKKSTTKSNTINNENLHPNKMLDDHVHSPIRSVQSQSTRSQITSGIKKTPKVKHIKLNKFEYSIEEIELLFSKIRHNRVEYVMHQLNEGFDPNIIDVNGNSMIHICAQNNRKYLAEIILDYGCDINIKNKKCLTALYYSQKYEFHKMSNWLITNGAML